MQLIFWTLGLVLAATIVTAAPPPITDGAHKVQCQISEQEQLPITCDRIAVSAENPQLWLCADRREVTRVDGKNTTQERIAWHYGLSVTPEGDTHPVLRTTPFAPARSRQDGEWELTSAEVSGDGSVVLYSGYLRPPRGLATKGRPGKPEPAYALWERKTALASEPVEVWRGKERVDSVAISQAHYAAARRGIWLYSRVSQSEPLYWDGHRFTVRAMAFDPGGTHLLSGDAKGQLGLWDTSSIPGSKTMWVAHTDGVQSVAWHPNSSLFVSGGADAAVHFWSVANPKHPVTSIQLEKGAVIRALAFTADGNRLIVGTVDPSVGVRMYGVTCSSN
jgi:WD40 repeat protein